MEINSHRQLIYQQFEKLNRRTVIMPVILNGIKLKALKNINKRLEERCAKHNHRVFAESMQRSPMRYTKLCCAQCYGEITENLFSGGKYYHRECAEALHIL